MRLQRRWLWPVILVGLLGGAVSLRYRHPERSLLQHATRLLTLDTGPNSDENLGVTPYLWRTGDLLLLRRRLPEGTRPVPYAAFQYDCRTGTTTPLSQLDAVYRAPQTPYVWLWPTASVSPDGRWLLIHKPHDWTGSLPFQAFDLPGNRAVSASPKVALTAYDAILSNTVWLPDDRHWAFLERAEDGLHAVRQGFGSGETICGSTFGYPPWTFFSFDGIRKPMVLGFVSRDRLLVLPGLTIDSGYAGGIAPCYEVNLGKTPAYRPHPIPLPPQSQLLDVAMCAGSHRLAWLVRRQIPAPAPFRFLHRWCSFISADPQIAIELYTTQLDGGGRRTLGYLPVPPKEKRVRDIDVWAMPHYFLTWLPDGKRLSFVYQHALWRVATE